MKIIYVATLIVNILILVACGSVTTEQVVEKNEAAKSPQASPTKVESRIKENKSESENSAKAQETSELGDSSRKAVSGKEVTGTFQMKLENDDLEATNEIKVEALGNHKLKVEFNLAYPFRINNGRSSVNVGNAQGEAVIEGDTAIYSTTEKDGKCEIKIKFVKEGLIKVTQTQNGGGCGFGLNVSAQGTYKKVNDDKPIFSPDN